MSGAAPLLGLYLSIPFCRAKCSFCNFASGVGSAAAIDRYVAQLCDELRTVRSWARQHEVQLPEEVDTIYFGGGTPSLLEPAQLSTIFAALRSEFQVTPNAEITTEAAPGQIGNELLHEALRCGVNRISLGVQSFVDREAQAVGRSHTGASCQAEFARLRHAGVRNLGADLIAGLPYQTETSWQASLNAAAEAQVEHLSVYMLEIDDESRLGREVLGGGARLHAPAIAGEDLTATLYERACEFLPTVAFQQYEISNFAKQGWRSHHNQKYWARAPYVGLGLDAHSMLLAQDGRALRWANAEDLVNYEGSGAARQPQWVTLRGAFEEAVFLGLRLVEGVAWQDLAAYDQVWVDEVRDSVRRLSLDNLMGCSQERLWLTEQGRMLSGEIFGELLAGVTA